MDTMILKQQDAIEKLRGYITDTVVEQGIVAEEKTPIIKDLLEDIELIEDNNWEWVAIMECPMAVSGITVREVEIK